MECLRLIIFTHRFCFIVRMICYINFLLRPHHLHKRDTVVFAELPNLEMMLHTDICVFSEPFPDFSDGLISAVLGFFFCLFYFSNPLCCLFFVKPPTGSFVASASSTLTSICPCGPDSVSVGEGSTVFPLSYMILWVFFVVSSINRWVILRPFHPNECASSRWVQSKVQQRRFLNKRTNTQDY